MNHWERNNNHYEKGEGEKVIIKHFGSYVIAKKKSMQQISVVE
jgi:hypothetical protein